MASIQDRIQEASSRNATLLSKLHETDSSPSQLYQQIQYINELETQIHHTSTHCLELKKKTNIELQEHKKYSESTFRRFAHKASGRKERFAEKAAKEERDYFEAIQEQKSAEDKLSYLYHLKTEAETAKHQYEVDSQKHEQYQADLDALYNSIFSGHTPGFPEEDEREQESAAANQHIQELHRVLEHERHILFLLRQTSGKLSETRGHLESAHDLSNMDMFGGGSTASMMKRNYLEKAESSLAQVRMLQDSIKQFNPSLADLGTTSIASGSIWTDVVFDNIFTDMDMHQRIKDSEAQVDRAGVKCGLLVKRQEAREKEVLETIRNANERLKESRFRLQEAREEAFRRVLGGEDIPRDDGRTDVRVGSNLMGGNAIVRESPPAYSVQYSEYERS
ncbi:hypothetical protein DM02DRAFT_732817 [Periconia macrospinosa]|uniref:Uncharacterized protein n=1 Tax=Periconia macrospinosa TaxID=97972 RepID=A0A2V1D760_9PLEO|nr:hypothetical protein DM02DRAFT_732817 [Periconia macrospinosa]